MVGYKYLNKKGINMFICDTEILTQKGLKKIMDLRAGDHVYVSGGTFIQVTGDPTIMESSEFFDIQFTNGEFVTCTRDSRIGNLMVDEIKTYSSIPKSMKVKNIDDDVNIKDRGYICGRAIARGEWRYGAIMPSDKQRLQVIQGIMDVCGSVISTGYYRVFTRDGDAMGVLQWLLSLEGIDCKVDKRTVLRFTTDKKIFKMKEPKHEPKCAKKVENFRIKSIVQRFDEKKYFVNLELEKNGIYSESFLLL